MAFREGIGEGLTQPWQNGKMAFFNQIATHVIMNNLIKSYRPVLTGYEIRALIHTLKSNPMILGSDMHLMSALKKLSVFNTKIEMEAITPTAINAPRETISSQLLAEYGEPTAKPDYKSIRLAAYNKWVSDPTSCSIKELADVETYRFENGLMDSREVEMMNEALMKSMGLE